MLTFKYKIIIVSLLGMALSFVAKAQDKLSLSDCIDMAINQNLQIKKSELQLESTVNNHQQIKRDRLPAVVGLFNPGYSLGRSIDPYTNSVVDNQIGTNNLGIKADWVIFNGYQRKNSLEQSVLNLSAGQLDVQASKNAITIKVLQAYMQVLMVQELLNVALKQAESTKLQLERIDKQVKLQVVPESNLYNLQAQLANDEIQITGARNDVRLAHMTLGQILNWPADKTYELEPVSVTKGTNSLSGSWQEVYQSALNILPEIKAADIRIKSAEKGIDIAKGLKYPTLSVGGSLGTAYSSVARRSFVSENYSETPINAFVKVDDKVYQATTLSQAVDQRNIGYFNQLGLNRAFSVGFSLRIPIFNSTQLSYRTRDSKIQHMMAENDKKQVSLQLRQQTEEAFVSLQNAEERFNTLSNQVGVLDKVLRVAEVRLTVGVSNPLDYTLAKTNLDRAKASLVQVKYESIFREMIIRFYQSGATE